MGSDAGGELSGARCCGPRCHGGVFHTPHSATDVPVFAPPSNLPRSPRRACEKSHKTCWPHVPLVACGCRRALQGVKIFDTPAVRILYAPRKTAAHAVCIRRRHNLVPLGHGEEALWSKIRASRCRSLSQPHRTALLRSKRPRRAVAEIGGPAARADRPLSSPHLGVGRQPFAGRGSPAHATAVGK